MIKSENDNDLTKFDLFKSQELFKVTNEVGSGKGLVIYFSFTVDKTVPLQKTLKTCHRRRLTQNHHN